MSWHGHVTPSPDGRKARCGGPTICAECAIEYARANLPKPKHAWEEIQRRTPVDELDAVAVLGELIELGIGDCIYKVRDLAAGGHWGPWEGGNTWEHPAVDRYGNLCMRAKALIGGAS